MLTLSKAFYCLETLGIYLQYNKIALNRVRVHYIVNKLAFKYPDRYFHIFLRTVFLKPWISLQSG